MNDLNDPTRNDVATLVDLSMPNNYPVTDSAGDFALTMNPAYRTARQDALPVDPRYLAAHQRALARNPAYLVAHRDALPMAADQAL